MIISKLNLKVVALNRFSPEIVSLAESQLIDISKFKGCSLNYKELKELFLAAEREANYISPDRLVKEIKRWVYDLGMPKAFFDFLRTEKSSTLNYEQLAKLIIKSIMVDQQHADFKIEFEIENKKFYIAESGSPRAQIYERRIWEQISKEKKPFSPYVRVSMHESKNPFIVKGQKIKVYMLSTQASKTDQPFKSILKDLNEKIKIFYKDLSNELKSILPSKYADRYLKAFVGSFSKPVLAQKNSEKILSGYLKQWLIGNTKPEIQIKEEKSDRATMTFSHGIHLKAENVFKILNQFPHTVERFYLNRVGRHKNSQFIFTLYFNEQISAQTREMILQKIKQSTITSQDELFKEFENKISYEEVSLLQAVATNLSQFLADRHSEFEVIKAGLSEEYKHRKRKAIAKLTGDLKRSAFTLETIQKAFTAHPEAARLFVNYFHQKFKPDVFKTTSQDELFLVQEQILKKVRGESHSRVFKGAFNMINAINATNYYEKDRESLGFLRDPKSAFENLGYEPGIIPDKLMIVHDDTYTSYRMAHGETATGRGGMRVKIPRSLDEERFFHMQALAEVVDLAFTQNLKNKDIPQPGAKGVIVLKYSADPDRAFKRFAKTVIQLAMQTEPHTPIELGPDENFKDEYIIYITQLAKRMGYKYANTIMSGKPDSLGGIGHKKYSVTTHGIVAAEDAWLEKHNLDPKKQKKIMAGGTGGDLSGGEILKSQIENVILNIDGPAIGYDPKGLDRGELLRLVSEGKDLSHFDVKKLSKDGFKIIVNDIPQTHTINGREITLTGREWQKQILGMVEADVFVPCGGARNTINRDNWRSLLLKEDGTSRVKVIFEGANVYIEEDVYVEIERAGIEVYRDLSANKGGVITSDCEINMGYIFNLQEFEKLMCFEDPESSKKIKRVFDLLNIFEVKNKKEPVFRKALIKKVLELVYARSRQEYAVVTRLSKNSKDKMTGTEASETLANAINDTAAKILKNYDMLIKAHPDLEKLCVEWYLPDVVFTEKSIDEVMKRLPYEEKIKPIVATVLASQFHYKNGVSENSAYEMFGFINELASRKISLPTLDSIIKTPIQELINQ